MHHIALNLALLLICCVVIVAVHSLIELWTGIPQ
jgi:hypothetical protein